MEFLVAKRRDGNLAARFADRDQTHDVLQCPSATRRIEPVYILDAAGHIVDANVSQVDRNHKRPRRGGCLTRPAEQSSAFLRDSVRQSKTLISLSYFVV